MLLILAAAAALASPGACPGPYGCYVAPDGRTAAQLVAAHVLPDPEQAPGVDNPGVTPATIGATICVHGWTATVRPSARWTDRIRDALTPAGFQPLDGELDHVESIEDGGAPADPRNLFWMIYADRYGARVKDVLETKLAHLVCKGELTLAEARAALTGNWLAAYPKFVGSLPK